MVVSLNHGEYGSYVQQLDTNNVHVKPVEKVMLEQIFRHVVDIQPCNEELTLRSLEIKHPCALQTCRMNNRISNC